MNVFSINPSALPDALHILHILHALTLHRSARTGDTS